MSWQAGSWTRGLTAEATNPIGNEVRDRIRGHLVDGVGAAVAGLAPGGLVEVTLASLRRARTHPDALGLTEAPFAWKPAFARRSLGLAAVRACAEGRFRAPAEAVGPLAAEAVGEWKRTGWRTFHWEPWYSGLGAGGRSVVLAEATTWATALWASFDWAALGPSAVIGGMDDLWTCPASRTVRCKGRSEVRVQVASAGDHSNASGPHTGGYALVSVSGGVPGDAWREELAYLALVAGLRSADRPVPVRVLGLWPDAGAERMVEVDEGLLAAAADRVVETVALTSAARSALPLADNQDDSTVVAA